MRKHKKYLFILVLLLFHGNAIGSLPDIIERAPEFIETAYNIYNAIQAAAATYEATEMNQRNEGGSAQLERNDTHISFDSMQFYNNLNEESLKEVFDCATQIADRYLDAQPNSNESQSHYSANDKGGVEDKSSDTNTFANSIHQVEGSYSDNQTTKTSVSTEHSSGASTNEIASGSPSRNIFESNRVEEYWRDVEYQPQNNYESERFIYDRKEASVRDINYHGERYVNRCKKLKDFISPDTIQRLRDLISYSTTAEAISTQLSVILDYGQSTCFDFLNEEDLDRVRGFFFTREGHFRGIHSVERQDELFTILSPYIKLYFENNNDRKGYLDFLREYQKFLPEVANLYRTEMDRDDFIDQMYYGVTHTISYLADAFFVSKAVSFQYIAESPLVEELAHMFTLYETGNFNKIAPFLESLRRNTEKNDGKRKVSPEDWICLNIIYEKLTENKKRENEKNNSISLVESSLDNNTYEQLATLTLEKDAHIKEALKFLNEDNDAESGLQANNSIVNQPQGAGGEIPDPEKPNKDEKEDQDSEAQPKTIEDILQTTKKGRDTKGSRIVKFKRI